MSDTADQLRTLCDSAFPYDPEMQEFVCKAANELEAAISRAADVTKDWKDWHRKLSDALGCKFLSRGVTLETATKLKAQLSEANREIEELRNSYLDGMSEATRLLGEQSDDLNNQIGELKHQLDSTLDGRITGGLMKTDFSERDLFLIEKGMEAGSYYKDLEQWLTEVIDHQGHEVWQHLKSEADQKESQEAKSGIGKCKTWPHDHPTMFPCLVSIDRVEDSDIEIADYFDDETNCWHLRGHKDPVSIEKHPRWMDLDIPTLYDWPKPLPELVESPYQLNQAERNAMDEALKASSTLVESPPTEGER